MTKKSTCSNALFERIVREGVFVESHLISQSCTSVRPVDKAKNMNRLTPSPFPPPLPSKPQFCRKRTNRVWETAKMHFCLKSSLAAVFQKSQVQIMHDPAACDSSIRLYIDSTAFPPSFSRTREAAQSRGLLGEGRRGRKAQTQPSATQVSSCLPHFCRKRCTGATAALSGCS